MMKNKVVQMKVTIQLLMIKGIRMNEKTKELINSRIDEVTGCINYELENINLHQATIDAGRVNILRYEEEIKQLMMDLNEGVKNG